VYMVARLNFLFSMAPATMLAIATVGSLTAFFAATIGTTQDDIKKVLAYSTVSQLGYMFAAVGVGAYVDGIFHLMTHAFFKACLFLGAGSVIHAMGGVQDMRLMGGLRERLPITFWTFLVATLALCGIPPFAGFMSKDAIIWETFARGHFMLWALLWLGAGITAFYMFRQVYMTFFGEFRGTHEQRHHLHESPPSMTLVLVALGAWSIVGGLIKLPGFVERYDPFGHPFGHPFATFLAPVFSSPATRQMVAPATENGSAEAGFAVLSLALVAAGWFLADLIYRQRSTAFDWVGQLWDGALYRLVLNKYYVDEAYAAGPVAATLAASRAASWFDFHIIDWIVNFAVTLTVVSAWLSGLLDRYVVDGLVNLASNLTLEAGGRMRRLQTGSINGYLYGILAAVTFALIVRAMLRA
jgi:NADH-quinone oxidoreductase subunit L